MDFTSNNLYINLIFKNQHFKKIHNMFLNNASRIYDKKYEEDKNRSFKVSTIRKKEKEEKSHWFITKLKTITIVNARPFNRIIPYNMDSRACIITNSTLFFFLPTDNGLTSTYPSRCLPPPPPLPSSICSFSNFRKRKLVGFVSCPFSRVRRSLGIHKAICMGPSLAT